MTTTEKEPTKPHYRVLVISQELYALLEERNSVFPLMENKTFEKWYDKYFPDNDSKHKAHTLRQRNYFIELKPKKV